MARRANSAAGPNGASTILHLLDVIDSKLGQLNTRAKQDAELDYITSTYVCTYYSTRYKQDFDHDVKTLRHALNGIVNQHLNVGARATNSKVDVLFQRGSVALTESYLQDLRSAATPLVRKDAGKEADSDDEEEDEEVDNNEEEYLHQGFVRQGDEDDDEWVPKTRLKRVSRVQAAKQKAAVAAPSSSPSPSASPAVVNESLQQSTRATKYDRGGSADGSDATLSETALTKSPKRSAAAAFDLDEKREESDDDDDDDDTSSDGDEQDEVLIGFGEEPSNGEQERSDSDEEDDRLSEDEHRPPVDRTNAPPSKKARDESKYFTNNSSLLQASPASRQDQNRDASSREDRVNRLLQDTRHVSESSTSRKDIRNDLSSKIEKLTSLIECAAATYSTNLRSSQSADVVIYPSPELQDLYAQIFGTSEWKTVASKLQALSSLPTTDLLRSLIAAFLFTKLLLGSDPPPWLTPQAVDLFKAFKGSLSSVLETDYNIDDIDESISDSVSRVFKDQDLISKTIKPHSNLLASECLLTLNAHIIHLGRVKNKHETYSRLYEDLQAICQLALVIHSQLFLQLDGHEWHWHSTDKVFDEDGMKAENSIENRDTVALTVFPGLSWNCGEEDSEAFPAVVRVSQMGLF